MRLASLNPVFDWDEDDPRVGWLFFDCPHCGARGLVGIKFATTPAPNADRVWTWNGEKDPEKITLTPSLNLSGHWHGFVTAGEVTNA